MIEQNPQWSVFEEPPIGTVISLEVDDSRTLGTTNTSGFFSSAATDYAEQEKYFPFDYKEQYEAQAAKYSFYSLVNFNELNGYTQDTPEAQTGNP